jgi:muramoyltetrapeptide carboxypeptidase
VGAQIIKPPALMPGETVGVVAISAVVDRDGLECGAEALRSMGYKVKLSRHALDQTGILAGTDHVRARELTSFFQDSEV